MKKHLLIAADLYSVSLLIWWLLELVAGDRLWPIALIAEIIHLLLIPVPFIMIVMLIVRHWRGFSLAMAGSVLFAAVVGTLFLPKQPSDIAGIPLRVMTYNLSNEPIDLDHLRDVLIEADADVIALQEISHEQAAWLDTEMADRYEHRVLYGGELAGGIEGIGFLSRYPIIDEALFSGGNPVLPQLAATLDIDGQTIALINVHTAMGQPSRSLRRIYDLSFRHGDVRAIAARVDATELTIVLGDFNMSDQTEDWQVMRAAGLRDAHREAGWGYAPTFPKDGPLYYAIPPTLARIDYIWVSDHFGITRVWRGAGAGSDHLPVLADLVLTP